jgi:succinate dehydrogenase hydrophobic anchor subunit
VVLTSVEGSIQLAESMEARGFGSGARTSIASRVMQRVDWLVVTASGLALAGFAIAHAAGVAADWLPYPSLSWPTISPWPAVACLFLFAPVLVWRSRR